MDDQHIAILVEARRRALETNFPELRGRRLGDVPPFGAIWVPVQRRWFWLALFNFCGTLFNIMLVTWAIGFWQFNAVVGLGGCYAWYISERNYFSVKRKLNMPAAEAISRMSMDVL